MKKILILSMYLLSFGIVNATTTISVKGAGGLLSDGTNHKVCPIKDPAECAKITLPPSLAEGSSIPSGTLVKIESESGIKEGVIVQGSVIKKSKNGYIVDDNKLVVKLKN